MALLSSALLGSEKAGVEWSGGWGVVEVRANQQSGMVSNKQRERERERERGRGRGRERDRERERNLKYFMVYI